MEWMLLPYKRYADFSGRSRRLEYWMFTLFYILVLIALVVLLVVLEGAFAATSGAAPEDLSPIGLGLILIMCLFVLGSFIPSLAVQVRRFHDQDKSGWLVLLNFIPYLGGFIVLVFMCLDGTRGENSYGPDPKGGIDADVFA